jgi:Arf-GAP/GTPase/ANK repeat/PH domain-containing protein 1/3
VAGPPVPLPPQQAGGGESSSRKARKLGEGEGCGGGGGTGQGRIIPLKQGYLYKKSGSSRIYRRKYVTLCSDGTITYYPSFQAYVDMVHGKEIRLQHVTVKIPGQKPTGLRSAQVSVDRLVATSADSALSVLDKTVTTTNNNNNNNTVVVGDPLACSSSSSSDEFEKDVVTYEACHKKTSSTCVEAGGKTPKRKRHRLSDEGGTALTAAGEGGTAAAASSMFELVIVSLESRQWQFQLCSQEEGEEWVAAIEQQIHTSLKAGCSTSTWLREGNSSAAAASAATDDLRQLPGNSVCADCGAPSPGWASLNLGTLICIECSGIHRQLGSHITKVRSLDLDSWSDSHLALLKAVGNSMANSVWEAQLLTTASEQLIQKVVKPTAGSSREAKEAFIKSKYLSKTYAVPANRDRITSENLVIAIERWVPL